MCRSHTALALWQLGFPDQALQRADETIRLGKELNHPFSYAMGLFFRRQVLEFSGRRDQARESIEEEYNICHENGFVFFEVHAIFGRGEALLRAGKIDEARKQFDLGLRNAERDRRQFVDGSSVSQYRRGISFGGTS